MTRADAAKGSVGREEPGPRIQHVRAGTASESTDSSGARQELPGRVGLGGGSSS